MAVEVLGLRLDCHECDNILKRERGCIEKGIVPFYIGGERYFRCPLKLITDTTWEYIGAYRFYKMGLLPNGNIYRRESKKYLNAMGILDNEFAKLEEENIKKAKNGRN